VEGLRDKGRPHERNGRDCHTFILPCGASGHVVGWSSTFGGSLIGCAMPAPQSPHPDALTIYAAVQFAAATVLLHEGVQSGE
jgi:hypothetical protein